MLYNENLIIERVKKDDEGLYTCRAVNEMGYANNSAYVTVRGEQLSFYCFNMFPNI